MNEPLEPREVPILDVHPDPLPEPPRAPEPRPSAGSLLLSVIGASLGAGLGALIWFAVEYFLELQVGYVAILVGALAGGGAVLLGRRSGVAVGAIAAAAGVVGILAGSYLTYLVVLQSDEVTGAWRESFDELVTALEGMDEQERKTAIAAFPEEGARAALTMLYEKGAPPSAESREAAFAAFCDVIRADESLSYVEVMKSDTKSLLWLVAFGVFGLVIGYQVGFKGFRRAAG